jgi:hypothetical protein
MVVAPVLCLVFAATAGTSDAMTCPATCRSTSDANDSPPERTEAQLGGRFVPATLPEATTAIRTYWSILDTMMQRYPDKYVPASCSMSEPGLNAPPSSGAVRKGGPR